MEIRIVGVEAHLADASVLTSDKAHVGWRKQREIIFPVEVKDVMLPEVERAAQGWCRLQLQV